MLGKLIVIEGTDCSGKETQSRLIIENIRKLNIQLERFSFPNYQSPTGRIIGGAYLGKKDLGESLFEEGSVAVDPKVAALYFAADRKYNIHKITWLLEHGVHVILDRYVYSNMAQQGCKIKDEKERREMYNWLHKLEFDLLELPKPDVAIFLHMPSSSVEELLKERNEEMDQHEKNREYLYQAEKSYEELSKIYNFKKVNCTLNGNIRSIDEIQQDILDILLPVIN